VQSNTEEYVLAALDKAYQQYENKKNWLKPYERIAILESFLKRFHDNKNEIIDTAIQEGGKPKKHTQIEFERAMEGIEIAIRTLQNFKGEVINMELNTASVNQTAFTIKEPRGVVLALSAFNHPINLTIHQVIPALAVGAPVLFKPASKTPLTGKKIINLLHESGLSKDMAQYISCNNEVTSKLIQNEKIAFMSFIGSEAVGWKLRSLLAPGASCSLEHGGVAPLIFEPDADIDASIDAIIESAFYHAGQVCVSLQRLFVHESILDDFIKILIPKVEALKVGDPFAEDTEVGPLISQEACNRINSWVTEARSAKTEILTGGTKIDANYFSPTVLLNPGENLQISCQEAFGPVLCLYSYKTLDEAIDRANQLPYAFQSSIYTKDINKAFYTCKNLNALTVLVNQVTSFRADWMPFAGYKRSGLGIGGIPYSMEEMSINKQIIIKTGNL